MRIKSLAKEWGVPVEDVIASCERLKLAHAHTDASLLGPDEADRVKTDLVEKTARSGGLPAERVITTKTGDTVQSGSNSTTTSDQTESLAAANSPSPDGDYRSVRIVCNQCLRQTNHRVLFEHLLEEPEDEEGCAEATRSEVLLCQGWEAVTFRQTREANETLAFMLGNDINSDTGEQDPTIAVNYYPARVSRQKPAWLNELRDNRRAEALYSLLNEIYAAVHADARTLAATGIRTLIESAMVSKVRDHGNFPNNLEAFEKEGFISRNQVEVLKRTIDAGNASAHRAFTPSENELKVLLDIAENLIETVFIHPAQMKAASRRVPKRPRRRKPTAVPIKKSAP